MFEKRLVSKPPNLQRKLDKYIEKDQIVDRSSENNSKRYSENDLESDPKSSSESDSPSNIENNNDEDDDDISSDEIVPSIYIKYVGNSQFEEEEEEEEATDQSDTDYTLRYLDFIPRNEKISENSEENKTTEETLQQQQEEHDDDKNVEFITAQNNLEKIESIRNDALNFDSGIYEI